ncbi:signal transduction histidine kinase [Microterricola gilva]|uniref:Signal transduction histidine kinase n=1 Tax=Microterricola gilva TaxID=393267 RepID=A0A4Q8ALZ9_9MICO|nr:sensor histidine kinase [Microterricola gilva]RZU65612.1 signal transduction histidine kinase [Microterricola gilva]
MTRLTPTPSSPVSAGDKGARRTPRTLSATIRSMQIGLHIITAALVVVAAARAIIDEVPPALVLGSAVVFSAWYLGGVILSGRVQSRQLSGWWLAGLAVIWVGAVAASAEFVWLAFSLWLLAGYILRLRWAVLFSLAVFAVVIAAPIMQHGTTSYANVIGPLIGGAFALSIARGYVQLVRDLQERQRLVASLVQTQAEMAELQDELANTQRLSGAEEERTRISRDIHDTIAQGFSSISLLATAAIEHGQVERMPRTLQQIDALARESLVDVRRIVAALAPSELEEGALAGALRRMLERLTEESGIDTEFRVDESLPALATTVEVALLRTAQSALANVRQHAGASRVVVNLVDAGDSVRLDIVDNGSGFDAGAWDAGFGAAGGGYGLHSMRARLRELGGGLDVESAAGDGVALSAHVPLARQLREGN